MSKNLTFTAKVSVRWTDLDAFAHVGHGIFFSYFLQARILWWDTIGYSLNSTEGPVVVTASCVYLKQLYYPNELVIHLFAHSPGRSSFIIDYEIYTHFEPQEKIATGSTKLVWMDLKKSVSLPIPELILKHLG